MNYLIGIDGGGTKTHCIITNLDGEKFYECYGSPSNFLIHGTQKVSHTILDLVKESARNLKINTNEISAVFLGTAGAGRRSDAERLENDFKIISEKQNIYLKNFFVDSDARIALEAAFTGKPGSILIAGTGSIMFGKDRDGVIHRVGGFGRFIGDEGSGFCLGKKGLIAVAKSFDGRGKKTLLTDLVSEKFKINSPENLITEIYKNNFDIASVAPVVLEAANQKDKIALKIIDEETNLLVEHIKAMKLKIKEKTLMISFIGGVLSNTNIYSKLFRKKVQLKFADVKIKLPEHDPVFGAILMAKEKLGV